MSNFLKNIVFFLSNRFIVLFLFIGIFITLNYYFTSNLLPTTETKDLWFYSGIFMVLFSILFIEPYYTSPKNVIANAIPLILVLLAIESSFNNKTYWWAFVSILLLLLILSIATMTLADQEQSPDHWKNKLSNIFKKLVTLIGTGKILYSFIFIYFLLTYYSIQDSYTLILFLLWSIIIVIDPKKMNNAFTFYQLKQDENAIGEIFGVQSKKIFLVKLFADKKNVNKFDIVKFKYSMEQSDNGIIGIVFDTYLLNQEKWAKVLEMDNTIHVQNSYVQNIVYKILNTIEISEKESSLKINNFVGVVIEGSEIGKIKFEYSKKIDDLQDGDLLELKSGNKRLFYQVINGFTEKEKLEASNESGFIEGVAIQLGEWQNEKLSFQKYGWVPSINTLIFKADTSYIEVEKFDYPLYQIGVIPGTSLPSVIDLNEAISHHIALLGVTGSGKSFLAKEIINEIKIDTKIICIDFNNEFVISLSPSPTNIIEDSNAITITDHINWINNELEKFGNQQDKNQIATKQSELKRIFKEEIEKFLDDANCTVTVFELPDVSNTTGILDYTKYFFRILFEVAKERKNNNNNAKICVVLEEAHTVIPEWNFAGSSDKISQSLVNSIGQITLQGRKYGVGFMVIAQRTANVSKTVLTQCNTVICFQAFDETSFNFLGNYVGKDMVHTLPNLPQYHAIIAGKAVKSNMPMIIDLKREI